MKPLFRWAAWTVTALTIAACGQAADQAEPRPDDATDEVVEPDRSTTAAIDPCSLLEGPEITEVLGSEAGAGEFIQGAPTLANCYWANGSVGIAVLGPSPDPVPARTSADMALYKNGGEVDHFYALDVPGYVAVGMTLDDYHDVTLYLEDGQGSWSVQVYAPTAEASRSLAQNIAARLP